MKLLIIYYGENSMMRTRSYNTGAHTLHSHNINYMALQMWSYLKPEIMQDLEKAFLFEAFQKFYWKTHLKFVLNVMNRTWGNWNRNRNMIQVLLICSTDKHNSTLNWDQCLLTVIDQLNRFVITVLILEKMQDLSPILLLIPSFALWGICNDVIR